MKHREQTDEVQWQLAEQYIAKEHPEVFKQKDTQEYLELLYAFVDGFNEGKNAMPITPDSAMRLAIQNAKDGRVDLEFRQYVLCMLALDDPTMSLEDRINFVRGQLEEGNVELTDDVYAYLKG